MGYIDLSGTDITTPDSVPLSITGDIDVRARVQPDVWDVSDQFGMVGRSSNTIRFQLDTTDALKFYWHDGTALQSNISTVDMKDAAGVVDGIPIWVRTTLDVDNGASDAELKFYYSVEDLKDHTAVSWTQLGSTVLEGNTTQIRDGADQITIGSYGGGKWAGRIYRALILDGIGGTVELDCDFDDITVVSGQAGETFTENSSNGATMTINGTDWVYVAGSNFVVLGV